MIQEGRAEGAPGPSKSLSTELREEFSDLTVEERALLRAPLDAASKAAILSKNARQQGNRQRAEGASRIAEAWLNLARDQLRAFRAEQQAKAAQKSLLELRQKLSRARALLEETLARVGRATSALQKLGEENPRDAGGAK